MSTAKERAREIIDRLPDDCTPDEIVYRLYVDSKIKRALEQSARGEGTPHEQLKREMREWLSTLSGCQKPAKT